MAEILRQHRLLLSTPVIECVYEGPCGCGHSETFRHAKGEEPIKGFDSCYACAMKPIRVVATG